MIMSRTPFRISLFGGGTDYPAWYLEHTGAVVGTTINKYCYISIRNLPPFFEHRHRIVYSRIELPKTIGEIYHPAVRAVLQEHSITNGVEIRHHRHLPPPSASTSPSPFTAFLPTTFTHPHARNATSDPASRCRLSDSAPHPRRGRNDAG